MFSRSLIDSQKTLLRLTTWSVPLRPGIKPFCAVSSSSACIAGVMSVTITVVMMRLLELFFFFFFKQ